MIRSVEFRLLGPVEVWSEHQIRIGGPRTQAILAALLLDAGHVVSVERLAEAAWSDHLPAGVRVQVQNRVSILRQAVGPVIDRRGAGYRIDVAPDALDAARFRAGVLTARRRAECGDHGAAASHLTAALANWRGAALLGLDTPRLRAAAEQLDESRITAREALVDALLALGDVGAAIAELTELIADHPWRESLIARLMSAHRQAGEPQAALRVFEQAKNRLAAELGVEPGPELRQMRDRLAADDATRGSRAIAVAPAPPSTPVPMQLPPAPAILVGRTAEVHVVQERLRPPRLTLARARLVALHGPGGVGKSSVAIEAAHALVGEFPDGALYVDLQGSTPGLMPVEPIEVLHRFLPALGVPASAVPADPGAAAGEFRSRTANRRLLIVADNAATGAQVAPLVPAAAGCAVIVTSRRILSDLDGATQVPITPLGHDDAVRLLQEAAGRNGGQHAEASAVARVCGGHPLALRIAAARLIRRPDWDFADLARRLADERRTLDELDPHGGLRSSLEVSYRELLAGHPDSLDAQAMRALGVLRIREVSPDLIGAVLAIDRDRARATLDRLVDARLLEPSADRFRMHDLVRLFATDLAERVEPPAARAKTLHAALSWYALTARRASELLRPQIALLPPVAGALPVKPSVERAEEAGSWVDAEHTAVTDAVRQALDPTYDLADLGTQLVLALYPALVMRSHMRDFETACLLVLGAGDRGDQPAIARVAGYLAMSYSRQGRLEESLVQLRHALEIQQEAGDEVGQALSLEALGVTHCRLDQPERAIELFEKAIAMRRSQAQPQPEATSLSNAAEAYVQLGRYDTAIDYLQRSVELRRGSGDLGGAAVPLHNLARVYLTLGQAAEADRCAAQSVEAGRAVGHWEIERSSSLLRVRALARMGQPEAAAEAGDHVLSMVRVNRGMWDPTEIDEALADLRDAGAPDLADRLHAELVSLGVRQPDSAPARDAR